MTWGASTHLQALVADAVASGANVTQKRNTEYKVKEAHNEFKSEDTLNAWKNSQHELQTAAAELNCYIHAIRHYIDFNGGGVSWTPERHNLLKDYFIAAGENWYASWDGDQFDNEMYVRNGINYLRAQGWKGDNVNSTY